MSVVSIVKAASYESGTVAASLAEALAALGGLEKFVRPGMTVVLKPNLVMGKTPETAATTHPEILRAVGLFVKKCGARAVLAESPGGPYTPQRLKAVYAASGMLKAAQDAGVELNYDVSSVKRDNPAGKYLKKTEIITPLAQADLIINLCKLKTHGQMVYTGAMKNMFGAVPGLLKAEYHMRMPDYDNFADTLIDIFLSVRPVLNIMDAVVAMEGYGPTAGNPKPVGLLLVSPDAFALDLAAARIIGADPAAIPMFRRARARGLMPAGVSEITFTGLKPDDVKIAGFAIPQLDRLRAVDFLKNSKLLSSLLSERLRPFPVFTDRCVQCGDCVRLCPVSVIKMGVRRPEADLGKCIRCFCCQELCPAKAVSMQRHLPARLLLWLVDAAMRLYNLMMPR